LRIIALILLALAAGPASADPARPPYVLIVHPGSRPQALDRKFLAEVFLRRTTRWPDDTPILPVDLAPDTRARARFSQDVLARSVASVRSYWQQRIFSGQGLPPPELGDDDAVVSYVLSHPGAIGYVSSGTPLNGAMLVEVNWGG
jgi:ABC-type phosphate transport system substrate-binding protein